MNAVKFPPAFCQLCSEKLPFIIMEELSTVCGILRDEKKKRGQKVGGKLASRGGESKQSLVNFPEGRPRAWLGQPWGRANQKTALSTNQTAATVSSSIGKKQDCGIKERQCERFLLSEGGFREILTFMSALYQQLRRF